MTQDSHPQLADVMPTQAPRRPAWVMPTVVGLVVLVIAVGGLGAWLLLRDQGPPADGGRYDTPAAIVAALEQEGVVCARYENRPGAIRAVASADCYVGDDQLVISIFATAADAQAEPEFHASLLKGIGDTDMVVGQNWTVNADAATLTERVAAAIGGKVAHIPA